MRTVEETKEKLEMKLLLGCSFCGLTGTGGCGCSRGVGVGTGGTEGCCQGWRDLVKKELPVNLFYFFLWGCRYGTSGGSRKEDRHIGGGGRQ